MDEFPTLEVAAAFGALVALMRTWLLARSLIRIPEANRRLLPLVEKNQPAAALALCDEAEAATYLRVVRRVLFAMREIGENAKPPDARAHLQHAFDTAYAAQAHRIQSGGARDLIAMVVLLGACVYAAGSNIGVSRWFYGFCVAGAILLAWNVWARRKMLVEAREASAPLLVAATRAVEATLQKRSRATTAAPPTERDSRAPFDRSDFHTMPDAVRSLAVTMPEATRRSPSDAPAVARCPACDTELEPAEAGARLVAADGGERKLAELVVCPGCGRIAGRLEHE